MRELKWELKFQVSFIKLIDLTLYYSVEWYGITLFLGIVTIIVLKYFQSCENIKNKGHPKTFYSFRKFWANSDFLKET